MKIVPLYWNGGELALLDQRLLPREERLISCTTPEDCHRAIKEMVVRGAPLIGITAMWGLALWLKNNKNKSWTQWEEICSYLVSARPTAVNLAYEIQRCREVVKREYDKKRSFRGIYEHLVDFIHAQTKKLHQDCQRMAILAEGELSRIYGGKPLCLMTLCNTGVLACGSMGTALGVISHLHSLKRVKMVYASETRPYLQGGRLSAYELVKEGIPHKVVVDGAASYLMKQEIVDAVFVGADRIACNGDVANKIGTSSLAIVAQYYGVPFYVVAPTSSFDFETKSGQEMPIELRREDEVLTFQGHRVAPEGSTALNPSFDITEKNCITGIFYEKGYISPVSTQSISCMQF